MSQKNIQPQINWNGGKADIHWYSPKEKPFTLHGLCTTDKTLPLHRIPPSIASEISARVNTLHWDTAGGRIRFATDSSYIAVYVRYNHDPIHPLVSISGQAGMDLYGTYEGKQRYITTWTPYDQLPEVFTAITSLTTSGIRTYTINLPTYQGIADIFIGLADSAHVCPAIPYSHPQPVLYYGSSITQGAYASRPGNTYPSLLERQLDTEYINLGFSGGAHGESAMAEYLASLSASVFICDYDYNAATSTHLANTHPEMYRVYRCANPTTPIIFISRPDPMNTADTILRQEIIQYTVRIAKNAGDENVYFLNGSFALQGNHADSCTLDGIHPNDLGFFRMAEALQKLLSSLLH